MYAENGINVKGVLEYSTEIHCGPYCGTEIDQ